MKKLSNDEVKKIAFEILKYIKQVCQENGLRYSLLGGTLLGAVRHNGFIPWDDDIDIALPLPDYWKLLEALRKGNKYKLFEETDQLDYTYRFAKLTDPGTVVYEPNRPRDGMLGVWVDIFPMLPVPKGMSKTQYIALLDKANEDVFASIKCNYCFAVSPVKRIVKAVLHFPKFLYYKAKGTKYWKQKRIALYELTPYEEAEEVGDIPSIYGERSIWPKAMFDEYTTLPFEGEEFSAVSRWDECLRMTYGDYMQLPPVEKRVGGHFEAYYREER